ncbi:hypothetical protein [Pontibacillus marinus]|uniref:Uncharacterized protein n=1 Tax=Pontibacillus marinus BH030004 = DSM 16465 TaxID=1385511 RepID=A0A0A5G7R6_9BACI|nr:hypothetical protein [Pontibacillus marinus]KGX87145.1 hypothetical protein N783_10485 [Pontibacillus marinus BH030004 = DSM 16465]
MHLSISTYWDLKEAEDNGVLSTTLSIKLSLWVFVFGVLLEWKSLKRLIQGQFKITWLFIPAIILTVLSFIPSYHWVSWFGVGYPFFIEMFYIPKTQPLLDAASGILFIRSISGE